MNLLSSLLLVAAVTPNAPSHPAPPPKLVQVQQYHAEGLLGMQATDGKGNVLGDVVNVLIDQRGVPTAAVIEFQGFFGVGNRDIAVAWNALRFSLSGGSETVIVTLDADKLKSLPVYTPNTPSVPVATQPHAVKSAS